jgi:hypothetical protein
MGRPALDSLLKVSICMYVCMYSVHLHNAHHLASGWQVGHCRMDICMCLALTAQPTTTKPMPSCR